MFLSYSISPLDAAGEASSSRASAEIASILPVEYNRNYTLATGRSDGQQFEVICAEPTQPPSADGPWPAVFLIMQSENRPVIAWSHVFQGDVFCEASPSVYANDRSKTLICLVTRPYSGSIMRRHYRLYRYSASKTRLAQLLTIEVVDGGCFLATNTGNGWPAFIAYEPVYEDWPKYRPQRYAFRLYASTSTYRMRLVGRMTTSSRYDGADAAYEEIRESLLDKAENAYDLPTSLGVNALCGPESEDQ
jgi:hypothetical protein